MSKKYFGWIVYEDALGCHEEGVGEWLRIASSRN